MDLIDYIKTNYTGDEVDVLSLITQENVIALNAERNRLKIVLRKRANAEAIANQLASGKAELLAATEINAADQEFITLLNVTI